LLLTACSPELAVRKSNLNFYFAPDTGLSYEIQPGNDSLRIFLKVTDHTTIAALQRPDTHLPYILSKTYDRTGIYRRDSIMFVNKKLRELPDKTVILTVNLAASTVTYPSVLMMRVPQLTAVQEEVLVDIPLTGARQSQPVFLIDSVGQLPLFRNYIKGSGYC
jgi:hypothetical protein